MTNAEPYVASWMRTVPEVLGQAIKGIARGVRPTSDDEFVSWVVAGLPPIKMRCGYRNGSSAHGGVTHYVIVKGHDVQTPGHSGQAVDEVNSTDIRNACCAAAVALRSSGPVAELPVAVHRGADGRARSMPHGQIERIEQTRTVWLAARWLRAGWALSDVAPLLRHGPGPEVAIPLLASGMSVDRLAEWAGHDLDDCVRWAVQPEIVGVDLAEDLMQRGLGPEDVAWWRDSCVPAANLPGWLTQAATGMVAEDDIPAWESAGVSPILYAKINNSDHESGLSSTRCREWTNVGIPPEHIRVYEHAKVSPSDVAPYGDLLAEHDPWEIVRAMGLLTDSEAQIPLHVIAEYLERGDQPYTAVFLDGHRYPLSRSARRSAADGPYVCFDRKQPPPISWRDAATVVGTGRSSASLFTLPSLLTAPDVSLMGAHHNSDRINQLFASRPAGHDDEGHPWNVGILYLAPRDAVYDVDGLIGVVTRAGHVGCLMPGYFYLRNFIQALAENGIHFVVPLVAYPDMEYDDVAVRFLRYRELRPLIEQLKPAGIAWEWPAWQS